MNIWGNYYEVNSNFFQLCWKVWSH